MHATLVQHAALVLLRAIQLNRVGVELQQTADLINIEIAQNVTFAIFTERSVAENSHRQKQFTPKNDGYETL